MSHVTAGDFRIEVSDPDPVWIYLRRDGDMLEMRFNATELMDLRYAVERAIYMANQKLRPEERIPT